MSDKYVEYKRNWTCNLKNFVAYKSTTITFVSTLCDYFVEGAGGEIKIKSMKGKICVLFHNILIHT